LDGCEDFFFSDLFRVPSLFEELEREERPEEDESSLRRFCAVSRLSLRGNLSLSFSSEIFYIFNTNKKEDSMMVSCFYRIFKLRNGPIMGSNQLLITLMAACG